MSTLTVTLASWKTIDGKSVAGRIVFTPSLGAGGVLTPDFRTPEPVTVVDPTFPFTVDLV